MMPAGPWPEHSCAAVVQEHFAGAMKSAGVARIPRLPPELSGGWIYGGVIARIMELSQQPQCSPHHPSPGWDGTGWVSPTQLLAPSWEAAARSRLLTCLRFCAGERLPLPSGSAEEPVVYQGRGCGKG